MDHNIYKIIETQRKEFGAQSGREVLGEEYSLDNLQEGGDETFKGVNHKPTCS